MRSLSVLIGILSVPLATVDSFRSTAAQRMNSGPTLTVMPLQAANDDNSNEEFHRKRHADHRLGDFASGDELKRLHVDLESMRGNLQWAEALSDTVRIYDLRKAIENGEQRDPEKVYTKSLKLISETQASKDITEANKVAIIQKWQERAQAARLHIPRFQLEGLWVGR
jgi:hypothetical protein